MQFIANTSLIFNEIVGIYYKTKISNILFERGQASYLFFYIKMIKIRFKKNVMNNYEWLNKVNLKNIKINSIQLFLLLNKTWLDSQFASKKKIWNL